LRNLKLSRCHYPRDIYWVVPSSMGGGDILKWGKKTKGKLRFSISDWKGNGGPEVHDSEEGRLRGKRWSHPGSHFNTPSHYSVLQEDGLLEKRRRKERYKRAKNMKKGNRGELGAAGWLRKSQTGMRQPVEEGVGSKRLDSKNGCTSGQAGGGEKSLRRKPRKEI